MSLLEISDLSYSYRVGERSVPVLQNVTFKVEEGEFTAIQGPSGSGKSTLFYILGGLLKPLGGSIHIDGADLRVLNRDGLALLRNQKIGFVFQQFHLLPGANVLENILLPCRYPLEVAQVTEADRERAKELARDLGIHEHLTHLPNQLSGGQQQRVAIARALMRDVKLILADEPTGSLDSKSAAQTMDLLKELNRRGKTVLIITHDNEVAKQCRRVLHMRDGRLVQNADAAPAPADAAPVSGFETPAAFDPRVASSPWALLRLVSAVLPSAAANLLRSKVKSALTMLGVIIGVAAILAMTTLGNFTKRKILESYEVLGVNRLGIRGSPNWDLRASDRVGAFFRFFDVDRDIKPLPRIFPEIKLLSPIVSPWGQVSVTFGGVTLTDEIRIQGVNDEYFAISSTPLLKGMPITTFHVQNRSTVCVIGPELSERLFRTVDPIGQMISVNISDHLMFPCRVIGVTAAKTVNNGGSQPNWGILVPYTYLKVMFPYISQFTVQAQPGTDIERSSKKIKAFFEQKYGRSGRFWIDSDAALVDQMKRFLTLFTLLLAAIASLALVVGGIGINNMMLVSISERLREIGLRKALGATDRSLRYQVLTEAMCLCLVAGLIGIIGGFVVYETLIYGVAQLVPKVTFQWVFEPWAVVLSVLSMVVVGIFSGLIPAVKAQKLEVIEALRSE